MASPLDDRAALLSVYMRYTDAQIARMCGVSPSTVYRRRQQYGIPTRKDARAPMDLVAQYQAGRSVEHLARWTGKSERTIRRRLQDAGIDLPRKPRRSASRTGLLNDHDYLRSVGEILTVTEIAEILRVHPATVRRAYQRARLPPPAPRHRNEFAPITDGWLRHYNARYRQEHLLDAAFLRYATQRMAIDEIADWFDTGPDRIRDVLDQFNIPHPHP